MENLQWKELFNGIVSMQVNDTGLLEHILYFNFLVIKIPYDFNF